MKQLVSFIFIFAYSFSYAQVRSTPDISVNFLGLYLNGNGVSSDPQAPVHKGFSFQEAELQFMSDVDSYLRASALFSVGQEAGGEYSIDPEEIFLETISIPSLTLRAGKFKMALGKHNQLHTHAFPFIDAPLIHQRLVGDEGLNESGVSASLLLPTSWYSELTLQAFSLNNEDLYGSTDSNHTGGLVRFKNLWDLTDDLTLELGLSNTRGRNEMNEISELTGADLTLKWRPAEGGKYSAFVWSTEYMNGDRSGRLLDPTDSNSPSIARLAGYATWVQYQFTQRWWAQARYEILGTTRSEGIARKNKKSFLVGFFPTEFSGFRLQYDHLETSEIDRHEDTIGLQYNITIGAHPAHSY
jgi:hypothetical protein